MKRIPRDAEKFDLMDLFSGIASKNSYKINDKSSQDDFIKWIQTTLSINQKSPITIHGKRVENLFAYVVGALGQVTLLKKEDVGPVFYTGKTIQPPDYQLVLKDGRQFFVEVKNFHNSKRPFIIKHDYYKQLKEYSDLFNLKLLFAIYFSEWKQWTLLPIEAFKKNKDKFVIDFSSAMAKSEMLLIGDYMIGVTPDFELHIFADEEELKEINEDGRVRFKIKNIKIFCNEKEIQNGLEKEIAFYLMRFGEWVAKAEVIFNQSNFLGVKFVYTPRNHTAENFSFIGTLSTMVTNIFKEQTEIDGEIVAIDTTVGPDQFRVFIPDDYVGQQLPLWRFRVNPNHEF